MSSRVPDDLAWRVQRADGYLDLRMGEGDRAMDYLRQAEKLAPGIRRMALDDEDLRPLWPDLES